MRVALLAVMSIVSAVTLTSQQQPGRAFADGAYECAPIVDRYPVSDRNAVGRAVELFDRSGLIEEALKESRVVDSFKLGPHSYSTDVRALRDVSELIVVGRVLRVACFFTENSRQIVTGLTVRIEQVLKGPAVVGEDVTVVAPGGRIVLPADSWVQSRWHYIKQLKPGDRMVSFLLSGATGSIRPAALIAAGQPPKQFGLMQLGNGTFVITADETLEPILVDERPGPSLAISYGGKKLSLLLSDLATRSPFPAVKE